MKEIMKVAPEVRLLKMLGEDLIRDEKTALIELVKNSYDADAKKIQVFFVDFEEEFKINEKSQIIIVDNGIGMDKSIIKTSWLSPGTAHKKVKKKRGETTSLGRIYQGEKGIGRYSMLKLGRTVELLTKTSKDTLWNRAKMDLSKYDEDFIGSDQGYSTSLAELDIEYSDDYELRDFYEKQLLEDQGTLLRISNLSGRWSPKKVREVYEDLRKLEPIIPILNGWSKGDILESYEDNFKIHFYIDEVESDHREVYNAELTVFLDLVKEKCLLEIRQGLFDDKLRRFNFLVDGEQKTISIDDSDFKKVPAYKKYFIDEREDFDNETLECGPFSFEFYIFNFNNKDKSIKDFLVNRDEKKLVESQRIYLYRDNIRVYPYGEKNNDWLSIDALRGVIRNNEFLSNGQVMGIISITSKENPLLQDKTNREGLIDTGEVTKEFFALLQTFLNYLKRKIYTNHLSSIKDAYQAEERKQKKAEEKVRLEKERIEKLKKDAEIEALKLEQAEEMEQRKKAEIETEKRVKEIERKEKELKNREDNVVKAEQRTIEEMRSELGRRVVYQDEGNPFFRRSSVLKGDSEDKDIILNNHVLLEQLRLLDFDKFYLMYSMAFRVFIEDVVKNYIASRKLKLSGGLGDNVRTMIEDMLALIRKESVLDDLERAEITKLLGGNESFKNELGVIKSEFHDGHAQQILATILNTNAHNPKKMIKEDALNIANNKILPLMVISQKIIEVTKGKVVKESMIK
ncbi:ATP-binding protein [Listeria booriae]|uniref:ATP-binding protein n=1 Tax=Listeria booriae TaxID=1552123 RepID=UPI001629A005|nr:ATP-binding protein [Listeria booriae]MBC1803310.1 ATP-binding protein [Listeria booriae]